MRDILPLKNILFRTALRITLNREEAEDIVQDTLLKLWERRDTLDQIDNLESFAVTMARNLALDRKALASSRVITLDEAEHDRPSDTTLQADESLIVKEKFQQVQLLINQLPEKQRTILHLRDIEGKTYKEIAEVMHLTESDVKVNLFRARTFLKKNYKLL